MFSDIPSYSVKNVMQPKNPCMHRIPHPLHKSLTSHTSILSSFNAFNERFEFNSEQLSSGNGVNGGKVRLRWQLEKNSAVKF